MKKYCLLLSIMLAFAGCGRNYSLKSLEDTFVEKCIEAEINPDSISSAYRSYNKKFRQAMSWYSLGCAYSRMNKDPEAIYALLKSKDLFTDTLSIEYVSALDLLAHHYNNRGLFDDAIDTYTSCRRLYERMHSDAMIALADYNIAVAYFGKKDYSRAQSIFEELLNDTNLSGLNRNSCYLYLAHIENGLHGKDAGERELELVEKYLSGCTTEKARVPGYAMKGIALYYLHENDSAFVYLEKAHRLSENLSTKILAIKGLEWVATQMKQYQAAWNAEILNKQYQEEQNRRSNQSEITQIQLQHNDEMQSQRFRSRVSKVILISISLIILIIAALIIYNIQRDRKREAYYLGKYEEMVKKKMDEKASAEGNRLAEACEAFRTGIAFNMVNDVALQKRSFKQEEREVVMHDINLYFATPIAALRAEAGKLGQQDINLIFCTLIGFDQELIADIMCTSRSNLRSIKSRLKSKISADTFSLYFKE